MEISSKYRPEETEKKWYKYWLDNKLFKSNPDNRQAYTIAIPPPNVTGVLHMGHMLNNTIQDVLVRRARMLGKNTCWVPGTDHASIATEAKVVAKLKDEGINKTELSRDEFLKHAWLWKEKHGGIILEQLKKLGASCDWDRTKFTMDSDLSESVIQVFIELYNKGYIYRGVRMVNWDPSAKTAVSDEEVYYQEEQSKLYHVKYQIADSPNQWLCIATTRPETILGDTAVCINPNDTRYSDFKNKKIIIPLVNRIVPIIEDEYVDMQFGTGCLKITPAHDINDYEIGIRYNLEVINIFDDSGLLNNNAQIFIGTERFEARKLIVNELNKINAIVKIEEYQNKIGYSERTHVVIEPRLSLQWFLKMKDLAKPALENVMNDNIKIYPEKYKNTYKHWMENVRDWCISRQLWWGHRIPAFYLNNTNDFFIAETIDKAVEQANETFAKQNSNKRITAADLKQDDDVLDTWFSSWLWPISIFDGIRNPQNPDFKYYYPTNDLITAPEILFFWVARMIIAGYEFAGEKPFKNVYLHGLVRDTLRRKMSKSLGNSPDPIKLIEQFGADGVRVGMLLCSPAGNDMLYEDSLPEQGRNFGNKIWNAYRLVLSWEISEKQLQPAASQIAIKWFDALLNKTIKTLDEQFNEFRLSEALMTVYRLFWDDFSSWYLEIVKPPYQQPIDKQTLNSTILFFEKLLKLLHPFMPFITEEIWQAIEPRKTGESIMNTQMPHSEAYDELIIENFEDTKEVITKIRSIRQEKGIPTRENLNLNIRANGKTYNNSFDPIIIKSCNLAEINTISEKLNNAASFIVRTTEYYVPLGNLINREEEIAKLTKELNYFKGFVLSVENKLSNQRFVSSAPTEVVERERKKQAEAIAKIKAIEEQLQTLSND